MPTILRIGPYRFFFYSDEGQEPRHIHVERDDAMAKFWLNPVRLARSAGFGSAQLNRIQEHVEENADDLRRKWDEYFTH